MPSTEDFVVLRGRTLRLNIKLFKDAAKTEILNLTALTVSLELLGVKTLTSGSGLTITPLAGEVQAKLTPAQTLAVPPSPVHYELVVEENPEEIDTPVHGTLIFTNP